LKPIDILSVTCLIWGAYNGWRQGLITELFVAAACMGGTLLSLHLLEPLGIFLHDHIKLYGTWASYILFAVLCLLILMTNATTIRLCSSVSHHGLLSFIDKLLGAIVGSIKWTLLLSAFFSLADLIKLETIKESLAEAWLAPIIKPLVPYLFTWLSSRWPLLAPFIQDIWINDKPIVA
jgi:membrane protein required for colicin V production